MGMPSQVTSLTPNFDRVKRVLQANLCLKPLEGKGWPLEFGALSTFSEDTEDGSIRYHSTETRKSLAAKWCEGYYERLESPTNRLEKLDSAYCKLQKCNFRLQEGDSLDSVVERTCRLLDRLPPPPPIGKNWQKLFNSSSPPSWGSLETVQFMDTNTIRIALIIEIKVGGESMWCGPLAQYVNTIAEMFIATCRLPSPSMRQRFLLIAFLWSSWHRAITLHLHSTLHWQLRSGYFYDRNEFLALDAKSALSQFSIDSTQYPRMAGYMCKSAFQMLLSDRASIAHDFRDFFQRYWEVFGHLPPRCITEGEENNSGKKQCEGDNPFNCMRFRGMKIEDQSAHASNCSKHCGKLFWSEDSYRNGSGARVVCLRATTRNSLMYCEASSKTMAISHVWSHGQGGRPEPLENNGTGFNNCLHERYKRISKRFGCDSYWMDTPCIPQDHRLRDEAIANINDVFTGSKLTLVCDKDLMQIDAGSMTLELEERILAVVLVCDWNTRAWTLLEAMRGRQNIWLLCRDDRTVSLTETLKHVHQHGSLTLSNLFLTSQHLVPALSVKPDIDPTSGMIDVGKGFVSIEEAASLLSHRHASRPGDECVIWSLLCGTDISKGGVEFWKSRAVKKEGTVRTGFLISSIPRIQELGWSWAPFGPDMPESEYQNGEGRIYFADDGARTVFGFIMVGGGLRARWYSSALFSGGQADSWRKLKDMYVSFFSRERQMNREIASKFLKDYRWGALLVPHGDVGFDSAFYYNRTGHLVYVVVGTNDESRRTWTWRGIWEDKEERYTGKITRGEILLM